MPWLAIVILILMLIVILALWGKLPARLNLPHQAPPGNDPAASRLFLPDRLHAPARLVASSQASKNTQSLGPALS